LSAGFLEPLESTSIHMIQSALGRLLSLFPDRAFCQADIDEYNRQSGFEAERIRDFLILHYHATERSDTPFWNQCRMMDIPDSLRVRINLWRSRGRIVRQADELFAEVGWLQVLQGQGVPAGGYHALADLLEEHEIAAYLHDIAAVMQQCVAVMPTHGDYLANLIQH
jgi:tryptophan halogenase